MIDLYYWPTPNGWWGERQLSEDEQQRRKALLFNQTNESVRAAREAAAKVV